MASGMITSIGGSGDTLDRLHKMVEEEREAGRRPRPHRPRLPEHRPTSPSRKTNRRALADQALADFAAKEGLALEPAAGSAETTSRRRNR